MVTCSEYRMFEIEGTLVSANLGTFGKKEIRYGFVGIEKTDGKHVRLKVDSYTQYDTLDVGSKVIVQAEELGNTKIIVARKITLVTDFSSAKQDHVKVSA